MEAAIHQSAELIAQLDDPIIKQVFQDNQRSLERNTEIMAELTSIRARLMETSSADPALLEKSAALLREMNTNLSAVIV